MHQIAQGKSVTARNAWGRDSTALHTPFVIEEKDIGVTRENYRGYRHSSYTFTRADVGKTINVMTDGTGWTCWTFGEYKP